MNVSNALVGIENASANFDSAAGALVKAVSVGPSAGDTVQLTNAVAGLLNSELAFSASIATEIVENNIAKTTLSIYA
jgi:hypothetical protein